MSDVELIVVGIEESVKSVDFLYEEMEHSGCELYGREYFELLGEISTKLKDVLKYLGERND